MIHEEIHAILDVLTKKFFNIMRKISLLFVATMLTLNVFALPQVKSNVTASQLQKQTPVFSSRDAKHYEKALQLATSPERQALLKQEPIPNPTQATSAPKNNAVKEEIVLNYDKISNLKYYSNTGDWFFSLQGEDKSKLEYYYYVKFDYFAPADDFCGTFTKEDFNLDYAFIVYNQYSNILYDDITLTVSKEVTGNSTKIFVQAKILGNDGNTYIVNCVHEDITPKTEIETVINDATFSKEDHRFIFAGTTDAMDLQLVVNSDHMVGSYDDSDIDFNTFQITVDGANITPLRVTAKVMAEEVDSVFSYVVNASILTSDTVLYDITMNAPLPAPADTIAIACPNLKVDERYASYLGYVLADAFTDEWFVDLQLPGYYVTEGEYTDGVGCSIYVQATNQEIKTLKTSLQLSLDEREHWNIQGVALGENNVLYILDLSWTAPEPTEFIKVQFETSAEATYWVKDNDLTLANLNDDFYASLEVFGKQPGEPFGWDNLNMDFSGVFDYTAESAYVEIADATNGMITQYGDTTMLAASLIGFNGRQYDIELWYVAPTATDTVEMTIPVEFNNLLESGVFQLFGYNADSTIAVSFAPFSSELEGTFINDGMFGRFGLEGGRCDFFDDYTYVGIPDEKGYLKMHFVQKGEMTVTLAEDNTITAFIDVVCDDAVRYLLTLTSTYSENHLEYDEPHASVDRKYTKKDELWIDDYSAMYGAIYVDIIAEDGSDVTSLIFNTWESAPGTIIPEGTYPINYSEEEGTVTASVGIDGSYIYQSYYAWTNEEGYALTPLWMMTGGTVEVSKNRKNQLRIEIEAVNSYDVRIHIVYDESAIPSGVENPTIHQNDVKKILKDGQLLIIRQGEVFNVLGNVVR